MKLSKNKKINSKRLFELQLIKSKTYTQTKKGNFKNPTINLSNMLLDFKKSINVIFKYHRNNKRILFIGSPKILENSINSNTSHTSIPSFLKIRNEFILNNFLSKSIRLNKHLFNNKNFLVTKLKKKPELIVLFNHKNKESVIKEAATAKIPLIEFNSSKQRENWNYSYTVQGNMEYNKNKIIDNVLFVVLNSIFSNKH